MKIEAPFIDEISGHVTVKMIDNEGQCTVVLKLKFVRNCASLEIVNNTQETVIFDPNKCYAFLDLRSLGHYKLKQGVLQQNLSKNYHFESVAKLCKEFNAIINEKKKEEEKEVEKDKYPWLDDSDKRKCMTDREILLCKAVLASAKIVLYFFKCLGFQMHFISLYGALSLHNCSSSGSLVFPCLGGINYDLALNNDSNDSYIIYRDIYSI